MSTRSGQIKQANELRKGDIIDIRSFATGYGFRYYRVISEPHRCNAHPENTVLDLSLHEIPAAVLQQRSPYGWNVHIESTTKIRVCTVPSKQRAAWRLSMPERVRKARK